MTGRSNSTASPFRTIYTKPKDDDGYRVTTVTRVDGSSFEVRVPPEPWTDEDDEPWIVEVGSVE